MLRIFTSLILEVAAHSIPSEWVATVRRLVNRGIKETGTSEDVPRTAAIAQDHRRKKTPANVFGALLRLYSIGLPSPAAELAATAEGYRAGWSPATSDVG
ncbi:hypothetical protein [Pseudomonas fluorescens]|uniref:hypothetical protein n=1 Tax=Pseudomonas fluorescens TaxID=294 RepID=UPI001CD49487|nr:hypothetical protein [Pseudomonas fluorescens]